MKGFDLKVLEDDKGFFPSYAVTPVVRKDTLEANPGLEEALNTSPPSSTTTLSPS